MLEEALRNPKSSPAEIATAMLSFIRVDLASGGAASEQRFFKLYPQLCERIFGKIFEGDNYHHENGGWLSASSPWNRSTSSSNDPSNRAARIGVGTHQITGPNAISASLEKDPVVELLSVSRATSPNQPPQPALIEALSSESENRPFAGFHFPFKALPQSTQAVWLSMIDSALGNQSALDSCTQNDLRLFRELLKHGAAQDELKRYRLKSNQKPQERQPLQLSPIKFSSPKSSTPKSESKPESENKSPPVIFTVLEHFLFTFIRFAASSKVKSTSTPTVRVTPVGFHSSEQYGEKVYSHLFGRYLWHFLPHFPQFAQGQLLNSNEKDSELFLRIIVTLWLENSTPKPVPTHVLARNLEVRSQKRDASLASFDLDSSYDLIKVDFQPMASLVRKSIDALIKHVVCDPHVEELGTSGRGLTKYMEILQLPMFNFIRAAFRNSSIHDRNSSFFQALNLWLILIEPWNVSTSKPSNISPQKKSLASDRKQLTLTIPRASSASRYSGKWEPYIASNAFLFTIPLSIFVRRARELDFSSGKFNRSLEIIQRVFRVFSPEVVDALDRSLGLSGSYSALVNSHRILLEKQAPPPGLYSMKSLQFDMRALLEEVHTQHYKNVRSQDIFDRIASKIEGVFGHGVVSGEEKSLKELLERARLIARLPTDFVLEEPSREEQASISKTSLSDSIARNSDGTLTDESRQRLLEGKLRCDPLHVKFQGDDTRARPGSYEIPLLIEVLNHLSLLVEQKIGFRPRLRFFADYRNLLFTIVLVYLIKKIML